MYKKELEKKYTKIIYTIIYFMLNQKFYKNIPTTHNTLKTLKTKEILRNT